MARDPIGARPAIVFFDVGDTLLRVQPSWTAQYLEVCRRSGLDIQTADLEAAFARALQEGFWDTDGPFEATPEASYARVKEFDVRVMRLLGYMDLPDGFYRAIGEQFARPDAWTVFADAKDTLAALEAAGIRRGVISNWVWHLPELLDELGLARHFEWIGTSARVGFQKPQPEIFERALAAVGVAPRDALHVGDNLSADIAGARRAGMRAVLVDRAGLVPAEARPPDVAVIPDLTSLLPLLGIRATATA